MLRIDVHAHAIVPETLEAMATRHPDYGPVLQEKDGRRYLHYPRRSNLGPLPEPIFEPDRRLEAMDRQRVDIQVIAIPPPNFHYHVPAEVGSDFARIQNDALADLSDSQPDRFHWFATLPLQDIAASLEEIRRVGGHQRMRGVQIGTNVDGVDLDDRSLDPVWEALASANLPVWLHPDQRAIAGADRLGDFYLQNLVGLPMESTIAAARLIFGGVLDRHPDLRFGLVHGGGFSPFQLGRWDHGWGVRPEPKTHIEQPPSTYFQRLYFDTLTHDRASLLLLGERVGWNHVMLGTDFPFDMAEDDPVTRVEEAGLDAVHLRSVLAGTAQMFLRPMAS
ncbi:MAG TPA: amidohydrolase family protein [Acidimicrobiia bacterium]|nr:amidohydrolase family protein [Acidimicrobiia bacterium]